MDETPAQLRARASAIRQQAAYADRRSSASRELEEASKLERLASKIENQGKPPAPPAPNTQQTDKPDKQAVLKAAIERIRQRKLRKSPA